MQADPFLDALKQVRGSAPPPKPGPVRGDMPIDALRTMAESFDIPEAEARRIYEARGHRIVEAETPEADPFLSALSEVRGDTRSGFSRAYDAVFTPPEAVTRAATTAANAIDAPVEGRSKIAAMVRGFGAGALQGAANLLTPGDVALTALHLGPLARVIRGVKGGASAVRGAQAATDAATVARGGERVITAESPSEAAAGVAQIALGGASAAAARRPVAPAPRPEPAGLLPPGPAYIAGPDGVVARAGVERPPVPTPDDPSFVRGVPAEYARREVAGLLPPARRQFIAGEGGAIASSLDDADPFVAVLAEIRSPRQGGRDGSVVRSVRAEVLSETPGGRVRQYAGDPSAVAPATARRQLSPEWESRLSTLREDARRQGFDGPDDELDGVFLEKLAEAREVARDLGGVAEDADILKAVAELGGISMTAESRGGRLWGTKGELKALFEGMDYGTDASGFNARTGGVKATKLYQQGGLRGVGPIVTQLKDGLSLDGMAEALRERGFPIEGPNQLLDELDKALVRFRAGGDDAPGVSSALEGLLDVRPGGKWWKKPEDEYSAWARAFDEIASDESGTARAEVLAHLSGTVAGGATAGASIEEQDPWWKKAAKVIGGAAVGAAAPALFRGRSGSLPLPQATVLPMAKSYARGPAGRAVAVYTTEAKGVPRVGRSGTPAADPLAGVDVFLGKFSNPLVREGIRERLLANGGFAEQRRQTINARAVGQFAHAVRVDASKALPKGSAASAEVITAYARGLRQTQERIGALAAKMNDGSATDSDVLALEMARADADVLLKSLMGLRGEAGRALGALRSIGGLFDTGNVEIVRGAAQQLREEAARFAQEFAKLPADDLARYHWLKAQNTATLWDKTRSYWYANLLSGVKTHERNILGNVFNALGTLVTHPVAAGVDALRTAATGAPRQVLFSELPHGVIGMFAGVDRGFSDAVFALRHGITRRALGRGLELAELGKLDLPRYEFKGGGANPFNWPGRSLDAGDAFFRSVARNAELYETAFTAAKREGLTGDALKARMADLIAGTSSEAVALREQAEHVAARAVFQEKGGPITSFLAQGYRVPVIGQAMTFTIPFLRTPGNILRQGLETSPVGFAMREAQREDRAGALAKGKAAAGSLAAAYLAWLASTGRLSGHGPKDPKERARLMESGWRPNSVRVGDTWVGYQLFQPVSVQAAIIANAYEAWQDAGANEQDMVGVVGQTMARAINSFTEQSFLSGLSDFQQALSDPQRWGSRWVGRTAQGMTPFAGMQRTITSGLDPKVRQPRTAVDQIKSSIPGLSESVPARLDRFGEEIEREGGAVRRMTDPFNTSSVQRDVLADELHRLDVNLPALTARMKLPGGRELTDEETRRVMQEQGRQMRQAVAAVLQHPGYPRLPDATKRTLLDRAIGKARADVARRVRQDAIRRRGVFAQ